MRISRATTLAILFLLPCVATAWSPFIPSSVRQRQRQQQQQHRSTVLWDAHPHRSDIDVVFGSVNVEGDEDEVSNQREQEERRRAIASLLKEQDEEFREARKKRKWGKYANATSKQDIEALEEAERLEIAKGMSWDGFMACLLSSFMVVAVAHFSLSYTQYTIHTLLENEKKQELAQESGVTLELLGPKEEVMWDDDGNVQITAGSAKGGNFFSNVDEELEQEWQELAEDTDTQLVNGEMTSRDALQGVRVGSAGGWSLEVFPGDFVVHR